MDEPSSKYHPYAQAWNNPNLDSSSLLFDLRNVRIPDQFDSENTFEVLVQRNSLGLGFSIFGGPSAPPPWTNFIRIKKIFPLQPAWETRQLKVGDILVKAGTLPLTGLSLRQALDILRMSPPVAKLIVCRPIKGVIETPALLPLGRSLSLNAAYQPMSLPPFNNSNLNINDVNYGEYTVELKKVNGSLGFTLSKSNSSEGIDNLVMRHTIKALVKEPAISDGRIRPGDKLLSANGVSCDQFNHEELIGFLRKCPSSVKLSLYRDASSVSRSQTPDSPPETPLQPPTFFLSTSKDQQQPQLPMKPKPLRYEAKEMVRSLQASRNSLDKFQNSPNGSYSSGAVPSGTHLRRGSSPGGGRGRKALVGLAVSSPLQMVDSDSYSSEPLVETPLSPVQSQSLLVLSSTTESMGELTIEEISSPSIEDNNETCVGIMEVSSSSASLSSLRMPNTSQRNNNQSFKENNNNVYMDRPSELRFSTTKQKKVYLFKPM